MEISFENSKNFITLKTSFGNFILPKNIPNKEFILGLSLE